MDNQDVWTADRTLARKWYGLKLAGDVLTRLGMDRRAKLVERLVRKNQDGTLGRQTGEPEDDDNMQQVVLGDYNVNTTQAGSNNRPFGNLLVTALLAGLGGGAVAWGLGGKDATPEPQVTVPAAVSPQPEPQPEPTPKAIKPVVPILPHTPSGRLRVEVTPYHGNTQ